MSMNMDHDHDHGTGDGASCPMIMMFHAGHCERILWKGWVASTVVEFVFSALAIFLVAFLYEALKFLREHIQRKAARKEAERMATNSNTPLAEFKEKTYKQRIVGKTHLLQTLLNLIQVVISYLLMLIFMTFNYWLCLAVVLGLGLGYFFFGWIKQDMYDNDCCQ